MQRYDDANWEEAKQKIKTYIQALVTKSINDAGEEVPLDRALSDRTRRMIGEVLMLLPEEDAQQSRETLERFNADVYDPMD